MRIPLLWLQDYLDTNKSAHALADSFTVIGLMLDKPVGGDEVLDLEQRLNRSDLLSVLGCARDLAVFENLKLKEPKSKPHKPLPASAESKIEIIVDTPAVNRFNTRVFRGVRVGPSPKWLQERLSLYGIEPKNNIVDITNFVMIELGQPMHAQDTDTFSKPEIHLRQASKGESIKTLLGKDVKLDPSVFILSSGGIPQVIGGIVGGTGSCVTAETTNIVLDAGNYDPRAIRQASRRLKLINETVSRYDKPLDPRLTEIALDRATDLILELAGGTYYQNVDYYPSSVAPQSLTLTLKRLQLISGLPLTLKHAQKTLQALGFAVTEQDTDKLTVEVPYWRTDLEVEDDLISEILRMYNYNKIPSAPLTTSIPPDITPALYRFEDKLRDYMTSLGGHEHITSQLVEADGQEGRVVLENALSLDAGALRMSATETLRLILTTYQKHGIPGPILFEIGKSFLKQDYTEVRELAVLDAVDIRATLAALMRLLQIDYSLNPAGSSVKVISGKLEIGILSEDNFILYTDLLIQVSAEYPPLTDHVPPSTSLDLSLVLPSGLSFSQVQQVIQETTPSLQSLKVLEHYAQENSILVRLMYQQLEDSDKTRLSLIKELKQMGVVSRSG